MPARVPGHPPKPVGMSTEMEALCSFISLSVDGSHVLDVFSSRRRHCVSLTIGRRSIEATQAIHDALAADRANIEAEVAESLIWDRLHTQSRCRISLPRPGAIENPAETWE